MSNPTLLVAQFVDSSGDFTITGPERYDGGLWLEEGTVNLVLNPSVESDTANIGASGTTVNRVDTEQYDGDYSLEVVHTGGSGTGTYFQTRTGLGGSGRVLTPSFYSKDASLHNLRCTLFASYTDVTTENLGAANFASTGDWQRNETVGTTNAGKTLNFLRATALLNGNQAAGTYYVDGAQIEEKGYATSLAISTMGDGYSLNGNNEHVRAASSAAVATAGHIDPTTGSLAFRFRRKIDTAGIEYLLICGTDGDDRLRIYVNDDDYLHVAWDTGSALPQYVISPDTIAVDTEYFVYTYWVGTIIGMSIDNGPLQIGVRDVPKGDFGVDDLVLQAT